MYLCHYSLHLSELCSFLTVFSLKIGADKTPMENDHSADNGVVGYL